MALGGVRFSLSPGAFFQTNTEQAERPVDEARNTLAGMTGQFAECTRELGEASTLVEETAAEDEPAGDRC